MPFTKIGPDQYRSPSGRIFNQKQVDLYKAHGDRFPTAAEKKARPAKKKRTPPSSRLLKRPIGA